MISSRHYMLNSFVPNLVWLPTQISKLTDREGSLAHAHYNGLLDMDYDCDIDENDYTIFMQNHLQYDP